MKRAYQNWGKPDLADALISASLFGAPDREAAQRNQDRLHHHFAEMASDPSVSPARYTWAACSSAASHVLWRVTSGPSTTAAPGILIGSFGLIAILLAATPTYSIHDPAASSGVIAIIGGVLVLAEARRADRSPLTRSLWALVVATLTWTAVGYLTRPQSPGDSATGVGSLIIALGLLPHALQALRTSITWRRWVVVNLGLAVIAVANLYDAMWVDDEVASKVFFLLFVLESATVVALMRWALSRRRAASSATEPAAA